MKNEKLLNYALESLKKGISVIPVGKDKIPLISWKIYQEKYATEEEVRGWFETFEDPQIGFVTGKISNLLVIDIEKGGDPSDLPQETTIIATGGQGYHYYFKYEDGIRNKARIKDLIDFRGEGGYVVSPNSVSEKGPYSVLLERPWGKFPKELFKEEKVDIFQSPGLSSSRSFEKKPLKEYPGYGQGQRNDEMARYVGYVLTQIHPADWDSQGWQLVQAANTRNTPPLPPRELANTFNSIQRTERSKNPLGHATAQNYASGNVQSEPEEDPLIMGDEDDEVRHLATVAEEQKLDQADIYPLEMPCFDGIINGGVSPGDVIAIAGQTGHGKTTLAQDWTMSLIRGIKSVKALWFSYEVLPTHLWNKFQEMGMKKEDLVFIPAKHSTGNVSWVENKVKEGKEKFGIKAVFIDHLGFLLPKTDGILGKKLSLNYSSFLTQIMRDLKAIAISEEVIIFLPVHMKKTDSRIKRPDIDDIKDSAGIGQESDLVFLIEREKERDKEAKTYYTDVTKITLAKNRKTGITVVANFSMINGRFAYDDSQEKFEENFKNFEGITKVEEVKKEPVAEVEAKTIALPYADK